MGVRGASALVLAVVVSVLPIFPTVVLMQRSPPGARGDGVAWTWSLVSLQRHLLYERSWASYRPLTAVALDVLHPTILLTLSSGAAALLARPLSLATRRLRAASEGVVRRASLVAASFAGALWTAWQLLPRGLLRLPRQTLLATLAAVSLTALLLVTDHREGQPAARRVTLIASTWVVALVLVLTSVVVLGRLAEGRLPHLGWTWGGVFLVAFAARVWSRRRGAGRTTH